MLREYYEKYKEYLPLVSMGAAVVMILLFGANMVLGGNEKVSIIENQIPEAGEEQESQDATETVPSHVFVEVKGAVKNPGVFEVPKDARVTNVLNMAEVSDAADLLTVNQSEKVKDEMVIYVPVQGEIEEVALPGAAPGSGDGADASVININTASAAELTTLNGIGEKKAQLILEYREQNGLFMKKEDLMNISGIGEKTFDSLEPYITID